MKKLQSISIMLLIWMLVFAGVYANNGGKTEEQDFEASAFEEDMECFEENYTFEDEMEFLEELDLTTEEMNELETLWSEAMSLEDEEKWEEYDSLLEECFDEDSEEDYTFEDEIEFLEELDLTTEAMNELEALFNEAMSLEDEEKWEEYDSKLEEYIDEYFGEGFEEDYTFEDEMEFLEELDLTPEEMNELEALFNEAMALEDEELAEDKWEEYDSILVENGFEFDEEDYTFEDILIELEEEGIELNEGERTSLEKLFNKAIEEDSEVDWNNFDEMLYELAGWDYEDAVSISAVYNVMDNKLVLSVAPEDYADGETPKEVSQELKVLHQEMWKRASSLIPNDYLTYFKKLEIGTDGEDGMLASVVELEDLSKWALFLDTKDSVNGNGNFKKDFDATVLHELGHIVTLNNSQLTQVELAGTYSADEGSSYVNSYINAFYNKFWSTDNDSEDQFVSDYASTNIEEDIAESFAEFIINEKRSGNSVEDQKVNFFYTYPELVEIREEIREKL